jgi:hypothetical protein
LTGQVQVRPRGAVRGVELEHARNGSLGGVFDHVAIAVSDLAASERFYGTVLSVLGVEPSHADAELVEWEDWDIVPTDREHDQALVRSKVTVVRRAAVP